MTIWAAGGLVLAVTAASTTMTWAFRRYALKRGMLDVPNERSSHLLPTPRGGGAAIVLATLLGLGPLVAAGVLDWTLALGLGGAGLIVALVGFLDDHREVGTAWRLLAHHGAAAIVVFSLGGPGQIALFGPAMSDWLMWLLALLYIVWIINLTNFMDGIDALATSEAIFVSSGGALLYAIAGFPAEASIAPLVLAAAAAGFLFWNRPPATVFMGDVGSGFIGLALAAMSLHASTVSSSLFWGWLILLGVFVVDTSVTLMRRAMRAERIHEAHRTHAYQHAAVRWRTHGRITLAAVGINVFWLLPLACLVVQDRIGAITGVVVAYAPLAAAVAWWGGGAPATRLPADDSRLARR